MSGTPPATARTQGALVCEAVSHKYDKEDGELAALADVDLQVQPGEFVSIVGPSGCGKTTLLKIIAGLMTPSSGKVSFPGHAQDDPPRNGLVFQEHGVFPWMTVLDNVAFGLEMRQVPRVERQQRAGEFIERVGLQEFGSSYPHQLSVGMRQRVGIARAFVADVPILLMDEPFGSLDAQTKIVLQEELLRLWSHDRKLVVYVTHDIEEAVRLGDRVLVMSGRPGRIREDITVPFERPRQLGRGDPAVSELVWHIWDLLRDDVRSGLSLRD